MAFDSVADFLAMGGHALYVWLAYGATTLVLLAAIVVPLRRRRQVLVELADRARREAALASANPPDDLPEAQTP